MYRGCTGLTTVLLPVKTINYYACNGMFRDCTGLTSIKMDATTLGTSACRNMFTSCSNLLTVEVNFSDWFANETATANWFGGNPANGTFIKPTALPE